MLQKLAYTIPFFLLAGLLLPVSGYRHLWQDEVETAELARSVLHAGYPRVVDPEGRVALNPGGFELQEGLAHRITPWGQYYLGAAGLAAGRALGLSEDASLRAPFILSHALTSSLVAAGLGAFGGVPVAAAVGAGTLYGLQTSRLLHGRTARYHAALDLLTALGMLGLGLLGRGDKRGRALLAVSIFLLPQFHPFGGGLMASLLALAAVLFYGEILAAALPTALSLTALLALMRPWLLGAFNGGNERHLRSLTFFEISYAFLLYAAAIIFFYCRGAKRFAGSLLLLLAWAVLFVRLGDLHPHSQTRYYLSLPLLLLFWPIALPWPKGVPRPGKALAYAALAAALLPEFLMIFPPWHGVQIVAADRAMQRRGERQPLPLALDVIRASPGGGVAIDYVPQYVNWYLRGSPVALMPDRAGRTKLNENNPLWSVPLVEPRWHLSFPAHLDGPWMCSPNCDYRAKGLTSSSKRYRLVSDALGKSFEMCVIGRWVTDAWNNAPFAQYELASLRPEGVPRDELVLAVRCAR